jgi:hypothetical protein
MSVGKGNAGEHLAMAELLSRNFDAYWADRGNPAFDIACFWNDSKRATRLRVKTTSNRSAVWNAKKSGLIFLDLQAKDDYVLICELSGGVRGADIYVVPTSVVDQHLRDNHSEYCSFAGRNGKARNLDANIRVLRFLGPPRDDNPSWGYDEKFRQYHNAWDQLM